MSRHAGRVWKLGDNVDTDQIIPSQHMLLSTIEEMKVYALEGLRPEFAESVREGDVIVAGTNFGCGSSREQAPRVLQALGLSAVVARSFARIYFRNSVNIGLPAIICDEIHQHAQDGDSLSFSLEAGEILLGGRTYRFRGYPDHLVEIAKAGGLIELINARRA